MHTDRPTNSFRHLRGSISIPCAANGDDNRKTILATPVPIEPKKVVSQNKIANYQPPYFTKYFALYFLNFRFVKDVLSVDLRVQCTVPTLGFEMLCSDEANICSFGKIEREGVKLKFNVRETSLEIMVSKR